jgi:hypothetical protein
MTAEVVGKVEIRPLAAVTNNSWNPNRMTAEMRESLRYGLRSDGWLASQALLIWGSDENGEAKNLIIDGEHRWSVAIELGFIDGPMVFLHGIEEARAKALTVKMNQKRGSFDELELGALLRDIELDLAELGVDDLGLDLGLTDEKLMRYLAEPAAEEEAPPARADLPAAVPPEPQQLDTEGSRIRMIQLFFDAETHELFAERVKELGDALGLPNVTDTVVEAVRRAHEGECCD